MVLISRDDDDGERREAVSAYIVEVNTTQQALILQLERVSTAYRKLQLTPDRAPGQLEQVEEAEQTLRELRARLAALVAPAEARNLRSRVLRLVDIQVALAHEVAGMVRYLPVQSREARNVANATERLRDGLSASDTVAAQRQVFAAFEDALRPSVRRLEAASAPDVLEPSRRDEIQRLSRLLAVSKDLRAALERQQAEQIDNLFARFAQTSASVGTTKAERQAVIAFNKRLKEISKQRTAIAAERTRLDLELR